MKNAKRNLLAGVVILLAILVWAVCLDLMNGWFSFRWFEFQVKRSVDPTELRQWATTLLAKHGGDLGGYQDFDGSNVPSGIRKVKSRYPGVRIFAPGEVWVFADRKGAPFLVVEPSSMTTPTNQNISPWKPGIYFVRPSW
jgi:hypothetical protein